MSAAMATCVNSRRTWIPLSASHSRGLEVLGARARMLSLAHTHLLTHSHTLALARSRLLKQRVLQSVPEEPAASSSSSWPMPWTSSGKRLEINLGIVPSPAKSAQLAQEAGVSLTPRSSSRLLQWEEGFWEMMGDEPRSVPPSVAGLAAAARAAAPAATAAAAAAAAAIARATTNATAAATPAAASGGLPHSVNNRVRVVVSCCTEDEDSAAE